MKKKFLLIIICMSAFINFSACGKSDSNNLMNSIVDETSDNDFEYYDDSEASSEGLEYKVLEYDRSITLDNQEGIKLPNQERITLPSGSIVITGCNDNVENIVIPEKIDGKDVVAIKDYAFARKKNLKNVKIPDSVCYIGDDSFLDSSVTSVRLSHSIKQINYNTFMNCKNLTYVKIPDSVTYIGEGAFEDCCNWKNPKIPNSVVAVGSCSFKCCTNLSSVPYSVIDLGSNAFEGTLWLENLRKENDIVVFNGILVDIKNCKGDVVIPNNVKIISDAVLANNDNITSIILPNSVIQIGSSAFSSCDNLKYVVIPDSVKKIEDLAFYNCLQLSDIYYSGSEEDWNLIDINDYNRDIPTIHINFNSTSQNITETDKCKVFEYVIENDNTITITGCDKTINNVVIPSEIEGRKVDAIGDYAFEECKKILDIEIPNSITKIGNHAFQQCSNLKCVRLPDSIEVIGDKAFEGSGIEELFIPVSVTNIGYDILEFTEIETVNYAGTYDEWDKIHVKGDNEDLITHIRYNSVYEDINDYNDLKYKVNDDNSISITGGNELIEELIIPETIAGKTVTKIDDWAFSFKFNKLQTVVIPDSVTEIGISAFNACSNIKNIKLGNSVSVLKGDAFNELYQLESIIIPISVIEIDGSAFHRCAALKDIYYPGTEDQWNKIYIEEYGNEYFINANIHFNSTNE